MSYCYIPINEPLYEALITKAMSYPDNKYYYTKSYHRAAVEVTKLDISVYDDTVLDWWLNADIPYIKDEVFYDILNFIMNFINTTQTI